MTIHDTLADAIREKGAVWVLVCDHCGARTDRLSKAQTSRYFAQGWPLCCGETMKLTPADEAPTP